MGPIGGEMEHMGRITEKANRGGLRAKDQIDLYWYLKEMCEATETLAKRNGTKLPECFPYAQDVVARVEAD